MVTRKAILIELSGGCRNFEYINEPSINIGNYHVFLTSYAGGAWHEKEIIRLNNPTADDLFNAMALTDVDYLFVIVNGYGHVNSYDQEDYVSLKDKDVSIEELIGKSKRQTIILDIHRQIALTTKVAIETISFTNSEGKSTRRVFDNEVSNIPEGILLVFSASAGEQVYGNEKNGNCFSYSLLKSAKECWDSSDNQKNLRIDVALELSKTFMHTFWGIDQNPIMAGQVRRLTFPPFALSKNNK